MVLLDCLPQSRPHDVRVNLRRGDVGMTEHRLYAPQVRSTFQKVGCEAVPDYVRSQTLENTGSLSMPQQQLPEGLPREASTARRHEQKGAGTAGQQFRPGRLQVLPNRRQGGLAHWREALLIPLSDSPQDANSLESPR